MNKKEKYINYVVDDLVKNTEIDYDQEIIKYPFYHTTPPFTSTLIYFSLSSIPLFPSLIPFANHVRKVYGAHSEEIEIIWKLYKERIESLINNE